MKKRLLDLGILTCPLTQREISVLAAPDIKLVNNKIGRNMRQELRWLLRLDYSAFSAVFFASVANRLSSACTASVIQDESKSVKGGDFTMKSPPLTLSLSYFHGDEL